MGNTYYYYKCGNAKRHGKAHCDLKAIRKEPLERFVIAAPTNAQRRSVAPAVDAFAAQISAIAKPARRNPHISPDIIT